ncbi:MAG: tetratricopeptide repeat protein [Thermodesulfobacteriota bacterium]
MFLETGDSIYTSMLGPETKFLVADGDAAEGRLIQSALTDAGYFHVTWVDNGLDALGLVEEAAPDFVVAAWELPRLGGLRLAREVRNKLPARCPCHLIVPEHHENEKNLAEDTDVAGFLVRPLTEHSLAHWVEKTVVGGRSDHWPLDQEHLADRLLADGHPEEALDEYRRALAAGRQRLAGLYAEVGLILKKQGRLKEAIEQFERGVLADPSLARVQEALAEAYLADGRPTEAGRAWERALALDPRSERIKINLAEAFLLSDQAERAEPLFKDLYDRKPDDLHVLNRLGMALRKQGKHTQAADYYNKGLAINERDENLHFNLGRCYFETGQTKEAVRALTRALEINPRLDQARKLLLKLGKPDPGNAA